MSVRNDGRWKTFYVRVKKIEMSASCCKNTSYLSHYSYGIRENVAESERIDSINLIEPSPFAHSKEHRTLFNVHILLKPISYAWDRKLNYFWFWKHSRQTKHFLCSQMEAQLPVDIFPFTKSILKPRNRWKGGKCEKNESRRVNEAEEEMKGLFFR